MSMAATPFIIYFANRGANNIDRMSLPGFLKFGINPKPESAIAKLKDHLIIVGYGINGKNVARAAKFAKIPHVIIEINPDTVRKERQSGEIIHFGDAAQEEVLSHATLEDAMILVITIPFTGDTKRIVRAARRMNPHVHIIVRTKFLDDMNDYYDLGADEVIPEEFETSIEIFTRVLSKYLIPHEEIEKLVSEVRADGYKMFRKLSVAENYNDGLTVSVPEVEINTIHVCSNARIIGKNLRDFNYFSGHKATLLAVSRQGIVVSSFDNSFKFAENDILFFLGSSQQLNKIADHFREGGDGVKC